MKTIIFYCISLKLFKVKFSPMKVFGFEVDVIHVNCTWDWGHRHCFYLLYLSVKLFLLGMSAKTYNRVFKLVYGCYKEI